MPAELPTIVRAAFAREGLPLPSVERVDRIGYSAHEREVIEREMARRDREANA